MTAPHHWCRFVSCTFKLQIFCSSGWILGFRSGGWGGHWSTLSCSWNQFQKCFESAMWHGLSSYFSYKRISCNMLCIKGFKLCQEYIPYTITKVWTADTMQVGPCIHFVGIIIWTYNYISAEIEIHQLSLSLLPTVASDSWLTEMGTSLVFCSICSVSLDAFLLTAVVEWWFCPLSFIQNCRISFCPCVNSTGFYVWKSQQFWHYATIKVTETYLKLLTCIWITDVVCQWLTCWTMIGRLWVPITTIPYCWVLKQGPRLHE